RQQFAHRGGRVGQHLEREGHAGAEQRHHHQGQRGDLGGLHGAGEGGGAGGERGTHHQAQQQSQDGQVRGAGRGHVEQYRAAGHQEHGLAESGGGGGQRGAGEDLVVAQFAG